MLQRYYVQYLSGYDSVSLNQLLQPLQTLSEEESVILSSLCHTISELNVKQGTSSFYIRECGMLVMNYLMFKLFKSLGEQWRRTSFFDSRGLRLDWCRLQAYTSVTKSQLVLADHRDMATLLNTIAFHTKMVDALDDMLTDTSDLSIFW